MWTARATAAPSAGPPITSDGQCTRVRTRLYAITATNGAIAIPARGLSIPTAVPDAAAVIACLDGNDDESGRSGNARRAGNRAAGGRRRADTEPSTCPNGNATPAATSPRTAARRSPSRASAPATGTHTAPPRAARLAATTHPGGRDAGMASLSAQRVPVELGNFVQRISGRHPPVLPGSRAFQHIRSRSRNVRATCAINASAPGCTTAGTRDSVNAATA